MMCSLAQLASPINKMAKMIVVNNSYLAA